MLLLCRCRRFFDAYQQNDALRQQSKRLEMEKAHAEWERDRLAAGGPGQGADAAAAARGAPRSEGSLASGSSCPSSPVRPKVATTSNPRSSRHIIPACCCS
jgi:hypothetical protein